ncbi:inositol 1,4,5-trisphosphate receptor-interacting protein-like [Patagioenas fasciata]|uniref:inositol 1,4,5-trisphosphate receptor-interacting protein-like n=1 Tax=Patagioenas fasciata TaxID=372321 RepID=UPI0032E8619C
MEGLAARGSTLGRARSRRRRGWRSPCCLPAASALLLPAPSSLRPPAPFPLLPAHSLPPSPTETLLSLLLQTMAFKDVFINLLQIIIQNVQLVDYELDEEMRERMKQREEMLNREMARLWKEIEERDQELRNQELRNQQQSVSSWASLFLAALQHWQFWAVAGGLVLLFGLCWWLRKRNHQTASSSKRGSYGSLEEKVEEDPFYMDSFPGAYPLWPVPNREETCTVVEDLVNDLLSVCRVLSGNDFMPRLQPAFGLGGFLESQSALREDFVYRLVVPLKPPPGHSFHLELVPKAEMLLRYSRLRVELECMCIRERKLGDMLCFIHHPEDELRGRQEASLLQTLCTGPYLDMQKTAFWLQELMTAACVAVLQSDRCKLTVLPPPHFCKLRMTNASRTSLSIELVLAVQQDNSDTFVTME